MIDGFRFDKAFLGVVGVDINDNSVMTYMPADAQTKNWYSHIQKKRICYVNRKNSIKLETINMQRSMIFMD